MVNYQGIIYLYGGIAGQLINDVYAYEIDKNRWNIIKTKETI